MGSQLMLYLVLSLQNHLHPVYTLLLCLQNLIVGALAKSRKTTITFAMSVCPSAWNNSTPTGRILIKLDI